MASYLQQAVRVRRKENEQEEHEIPQNTKKTHHEIYPQQPGDRDHLETACDETRPTRQPILARFLRRSRVYGNRPRLYINMYILALMLLRRLCTFWCLFCGQRSFVFFCGDTRMYLRFRGCQVVLDVKLSVRARLDVYCCARGVLCCCFLQQRAESGGLRCAA